MKIVSEKISPFELMIRIRVFKGRDLVYGSGISEILQLTSKYHSLHKASKEMRMDYKKALRIVDRAEKELGEKILIRSIGGVGGGGSDLTEFGVRLVKEYIELENEIKEKIEIIAEKHLNNWEKINKKEISS